MKNFESSCKINVVCAKKALEKHMKRYDHCTIKTQTAYLYDILNFFSYMEQNYENPSKYVYIDEERLTDWINSIAPNRNFLRLSAILQRVGYFMEELFSKEIISLNPMGIFKCRFGKDGWNGIARSFKSIDPQTSLNAVRIRPKFTGCFGKQAKTYLEFHRSVGNKFQKQEFVLVNFNRFLDKNSIKFTKMITSKLIREWIFTVKCGQRCCRDKTFVLKNFFNYLVSVGCMEHNPVTDTIIDDIGIPSRNFRPYIFSTEQIRRILEETKKLKRVTIMPLRPQMIYTIITILYTLGFRISEALNIRVNDIDFEQNTIFIPQTKFYKQRLVPFGPNLSKCINDYVKLRYKVHSNVKKKDYLFVNINNIPITDVCVRDNFKHLMKSSDIPEASKKNKPRLHDLRHSFAVHRLCRWYRDGVDVQNRLVLLSTFMGHFDIKSTQVYLTITDDLLKQANKRFYKNFGTFIGKDAYYEE